MKILIVDDHVLILEALRGVLEELRSDAAIIEASDCRQAMRLIDEHADIELILLDLNLPDRDGFSMITELLERYPAISIVVLSSSHTRKDVVRAFDLGAVGFIPKSAQRQVMLCALELVLSGGIYIPPEILARAEALPTQPRLRRRASNRSAASPADLGLTGRQIDVLALMMHGMSNKEICRALDLAAPTVKNYVTAILKALKVTNRTEAVIVVGELGWDFPPAGNHSVRS